MDILGELKFPGKLDIVENDTLEDQLYTFARCATCQIPEFLGTPILAKLIPTAVRPDPQLQVVKN